MPSETSTPTQVRIRTTDGNAWRYDAIEGAADLYDCNMSDAAAFACSDVRQFVEVLGTVLERDDLTAAQKQAIADAFTDTPTKLTVDVDETVSVGLGDD